MCIVIRETADGNEFMQKQDLIDAAEASGLSRAPIMYVDYFHLIANFLLRIFIYY